MILVVQNNEKMGSVIRIVMSDFGTLISDWRNNQELLTVNMNLTPNQYLPVSEWNQGKLDFLEKIFRFPWVMAHL